jgi:hypothetical protein
VLLCIIRKNRNFGADRSKATVTFFSGTLIFF